MCIRDRLQSALQQGSQRTGVGGSRVFRQAFVIAEIALALLLLAGAGLLMRSFERLISVNPGFVTEHLLAIDMFISPAKYRDQHKRSQYMERVLDGVRSVPGVQAVGSTHFLPLTGFVSGSCFGPAPGLEPNASSPSADFLVISPGYFQTMGTPMLRGRDFAPQDLSLIHILPQQRGLHAEIQAPAASRPTRAVPDQRAWQAPGDR